MDNNYQLDKLHNLELKIAKEIKRICEKNDIKYFITAGTLLGAARHGGFIPWDDDMDIGMLRCEYDKFLKACKLDLGEEYYLQTCDTEESYPFSFAKVRLKGTHFIEEFSLNAKISDGIFVDIFPFDSVPDNPLERKIQKMKYFFCKRIMWIKMGMGTNMKRQSFKQRIKYACFKFISYFIPYNLVKNYYKKVQTKYNHLNTEYVVTDGSYSFEKEMIKREWVNNLSIVVFEGEYFYTFKDKEIYLTKMYGDFMKLPPENQRNRHLRLNIDFGSY